MMVPKTGSISQRQASVLRWLGAISYSVYVLQMWGATLVRQAGELVEGRSFTGLSVSGVIAFVALLVAVATALEAFYDRPIRRRLKAALG
jgi:peptidoglycan/LPS O-acetylase OafA/YrhL